MNRPTTLPRQGTEPPLWSIAAAAAVIILTPMVLFSLAPEGPIREGDTVFSTGAHKVALYRPEQHRQAGCRRGSHDIRERRVVYGRAN